MTVTQLELPRRAGLQASVQPLYVLKFGSSVLRTVGDLPRVAGEIYRQRRAGRLVVAVVSALFGETNELLRVAESVSGATDCEGVPDLVSLGEEQAAALLRLACSRIGLRSRICRAEQLGLLTTSCGTDSSPKQLQADYLTSQLQTTGLVIVPGFVGVDDGGARTLLGRGGSDFSAIFLAGELGADKVCLYKDVDGVFESDPSTFKTARRYTRISWVDALQVARPLLQPQAVEYAQERGLTIAVEALGSSESTVVGPRTSAPAYHEQAPPLRIALAGYGIVGQALAERLLAEDHLRIEVILVRETARPRQYPAPAPLTTSLDGFLAVEADVVIDALSCDLTGSLLCRRALKRGLDVVSASKRTVSRDHARLREAASGSRRQILYSAAVGGSTAILETIDLATRAGKIVEVTGVLNGTVNFILQRLSQGCDFSEALSEAKTRGFAEEDSYADLSGEDAAAKLRLIAHRASGVEPCSLSVPCEHLDEDRAETIRRSGERWVQVGQVRWLADGSIISDVTLKPARFVTSLTALDNEWNSAEVKLADGRTFQCIGRGAGGAPTSEAIVADLYDLLKRRAAARTFASAGVTCLD